MHATAVGVESIAMVRIMNQTAQNWLTLIGRLAIAWLFVQAGWSKLMAVPATIGYMQKFGMPQAEILVWPAIAIELLGGIALAIGWQARWMAAIFVLFLVIATVVFHPYWAFDAAQVAAQKNNFFKNLAILGAMLLIMAFGPGRYSVDGRSVRSSLGNA